MRVCTALHGAARMLFQLNKAELHLLSTLPWRDSRPMQQGRASTNLTPRSAKGSLLCLAALDASAASASASMRSPSIAPAAALGSGGAPLSPRHSSHLACRARQLRMYHPCSDANWAPEQHRDGRPARLATASQSAVARTGNTSELHCRHTAPGHVCNTTWQSVRKGISSSWQQRLAHRTSACLFQTHPVSVE